MSLWKVMNVEVEMDFLDADFMERYENAYEKMEKEIAKINPTAKVSEMIREKCDAMAGFIIDLFGEEVHQKMFGGRKSIDLYVRAANDIFDARVAQDERYKQLQSKFKVKNGKSNSVRFQNSHKKRYHK